MKRFILITSLLFIFSFIEKAKASEENCVLTSSSIVEKLSCLENVTFKELTSTIINVRVFELQFAQPIDHQYPSLGNFKQRVVLLHRNEDEPMVLQTSGYSIFGIAEAAITSTFKTNQIQIEHRYFSTSKPDVVDWSKLDIKQSADDFHKITVALKKIYPNAWVNTGASKGGMTSIYHRRFYPHDLVGTVADVAPLSFSTDDQRYIDFLNNVGGDEYAECRRQFNEIQKTLLMYRDSFSHLLNGNFNQLGSKELAFEHSVIEAPFYFWQYGNPDDLNSGCRSLPILGTPMQMFEYLQTLASISDYTDESIQRFQPYYYQAATQLGNPANYTAHLEPLRQFEFSIDQYTPKGVRYTYSNAAMRDIQNWVKTEADQVIFIYGATDPWTAGEFPVSVTGKEVHKFYVPKGNHRVKFTNLTSEERALVTRTLAGWLGKAPVKEKGDTVSKGLEDIEFEARKHFKLK